MEKRRGWEQKDLKFIKDNYGKMLVGDIASCLSRSYNSIVHKVDKLCLDNPRSWTQQEDRLVIENYENNPSVWKMFPNRSRAAVTQRARKTFNLRRTCGEYEVNWKFFDDQSPEMAYVLGFICADGCVEPHLRRLSISLCKQDSQLLYDIRSVMECHNPLCFKNFRNEVSLYIHNAHIIDSLHKWGIVYKKTHRTIFPDLSFNNRGHFVRGLLDGDGSVFISISHKKGRVQFLGSRDLLTQLRVELIQIGCSSKPMVRNHGGTMILSYSSSKDLIIIYNYVYYGATIMLRRKFNTFDNIVKDILQKEPSLEEKSLEKLIQLKSGEPISGQS